MEKLQIKINPQLRLRPWQQSDRFNLAQLANDYELWRNVRNMFPHPYTDQDATDWLAEREKDEHPVHFAIEFNNQAIGAVGLLLGNDVFSGTAEIGYWVGQPYWGQGIATAALAAATEHGFSHFKLRRIGAQVFGWNTASVRVLEKCGYAYEGKRPAAIIKEAIVTDYLLYGKLAPPSSPDTVGTAGTEEDVAV